MFPSVGSSFCFAGARCRTTRRSRSSLRFTRGSVCGIRHTGGFDGAAWVIGGEGEDWQRVSGQVGRVEDACSCFADVSGYTGAAGCFGAAGADELAAQDEEGECVWRAHGCRGVADEVAEVESEFVQSKIRVKAAKGRDLIYTN